MILLDADVLLDVALDRPPHAEASGALLSHLEMQGPMAFVAWHTLANVYYLVRPTQGGARVRDFLLDLTSFVTVAPSDTDAFRHAIRLPLKDFEDAMQVGAAYACGATVIATRNVADFRDSPIPAKTPAEVLADLT